MRPPALDILFASAMINTLLARVGFNDYLWRAWQWGTDGWLMIIRKLNIT